MGRGSRTREESYVLNLEIAQEKSGCLDWHMQIYATVNFLAEIPISFIHMKSLKNLLDDSFVPSLPFCPLPQYFKLEIVMPSGQPEDRVGTSGPGHCCGPQVTCRGRQQGRAADVTVFVSNAGGNQRRLVLL